MFSNEVYEYLEGLIDNYWDGDDTYTVEEILEEIRAAQFENKISADEAADLIDELPLEEDEDLDDGQLSVSEKTGGIKFEDFDEVPDTSSLDYLDNFEEEVEDNTGFLTELGKEAPPDTSSLDYLDDFEDEEEEEDGGILGFLKN